MYGFSLTYANFIGRMVLYLTGRLIVIVTGWEGIGVMSILLIGFWARREAYGSSFAAVLYNRIRDVGIMFILMQLDIGMV